MINFDKWIELYGNLYEINKAEENFYINLLNEFPQHAKALNVEAGLALLPSKLAYKYDVTVTDSHEQFIKHILTKQTNSEIQPPTFHIDSADIAKYLGKEFFNVIFSINSRLMFLKNRDAVVSLLKDTMSLLTKNGYVVFDMINFSRYNLENDTFDIPTRKNEKLSLVAHIDHKDGKYFLNQTANITNGESIEVVKDEEICVLTKDQITEIAKEVGYKSIEYFGDYNRTPYQKDGYRLVCVLQK